MKGQELTQALRLYHEGQRQGMKIDNVTYSALTSACEKGHNLTQALRLFEDVRR